MKSEEHSHFLPMAKSVPARISNFFEIHAIRDVRGALIFHTSWMRKITDIYAADVNVTETRRCAFIQSVLLSVRDMSTLKAVENLVSML